jgi:hypothetical protein
MSLKSVPFFPAPVSQVAVGIAWSVSRLASSPADLSPEESGGSEPFPRVDNGMGREYSKVLERQFVFGIPALKRRRVVNRGTPFFPIHFVDVS